MKPSIVNWTYIALGWVLLNNALTVLLAFQNSEITLVIFPGPIIVASIFAIIGLMRVAPWSRIVSIIVITVQSTSTFFASLQYHITAETGIEDLVTSSIIVDMLLLFLAFRLYSSESLKKYLSNTSQV